MKCKYMAKDHLTKITKYKDYNVCIVNCPSDMSSDLGNIISSSENIDFAVLWNYNNPKEEYRISLRDLLFKHLGKDAVLFTTSKFLNLF